MPSSRRTPRRREHPRDGHGPPLQTGENDAADWEARNVKFVRRGGIHPARATPPRRERPREGHGPPLQTVENDAADREVRSVKFVRRGGIHPARATLCRRERPRADMESAPTMGFPPGGHPAFPCSRSLPERM